MNSRSTFNDNFPDVNKALLDIKDGNAQKSMLYDQNHLDRTTEALAWAREGDIGFEKEEIIKELIEGVADSEDPNIILTHDGNTALTLAAYLGYDRIIADLIKANADLNAQNNNNDTALIYAAYRNQTKIALALINANADPDSVNKFGDTALLRSAARSSCASTAKALIDVGADVNVQNVCGDTALILAARSGRADIVKILIDAKADPTITNNEGNTALDCALGKGYNNIAKSLSEAGATLTVKWFTGNNSPSSKGNTFTTFNIGHQTRASENNINQQDPYTTLKAT